MPTSRTPTRSPPSIPGVSFVEEALTRALAEPDAPDVVSVYLFGSVAEAREHRESDIDLGVLLSWASHPHGAERFEARLRLTGRLQESLGRTVDLVVLNDAPPLLARHVATVGRRILCRDPRADRDFVRDAQLRAADLEPWLRRMRELKLQAIRG